VDNSGSLTPLKEWACTREETIPDTRGTTCTFYDTFGSKRGVDFEVDVFGDTSM